MDEIETNRALNRAMRFLNLAAVALTACEAPSVRNLLASITDVIGEAVEAQQSIVQRHPSLGYHLDNSRPPTEFMSKVSSLADEAEEALIRGARQIAIAKLDEALALEPPALVYEILEKRREDIFRHP